jgi:hypothetical protein
MEPAGGNGTVAVQRLSVAAASVADSDQEPLIAVPEE